MFPKGWGRMPFSEFTLTFTRTHRRGLPPGHTRVRNATALNGLRTLSLWALPFQPAEGEAHFFKTL